jgi:hypothetical protein
MMRDMAWLSVERPMRIRREWCCFNSVMVEHFSTARSIGVGGGGGGGCTRQQQLLLLIFRLFVASCCSLVCQQLDKAIYIPPKLTIRCW